MLTRLEDPATGEIRPKALQVEIPKERREQARTAGENLRELLYTKFHFVDGADPSSKEPTELVLNRTWRAFLEVIAFDGAPPPGEAGNVLRPETTLKLSLRLPPTLSAKQARAALKETLTANPPYNAKVSLE